MNLEDDNEQEDTIEEQDATEHSGDIRSMVAAAFDQTTETQPAEESESTRETARDEGGRFAKKQNSDLETEKQVEAEEPIDAPYSWSADEKERFKQLPRELKQYLSKREQERESFISRKSQESEQVRRKFEPVDRILNEYGEVFRKANVDPVQGIEQLVRAQQFLDTDPRAAIRLMAQSYGVDLNEIASEVGQPIPTERTPHFHFLTQKLGTLEQQLSSIQQERVAQQQRQAVAEVAAFEQERDKSGALLRPYLNEVRSTMAEELRLRQAKFPDEPARDALQNAYEAAVWKTAEVREKLQAKVIQERTEARRVQTAKIAGSSIKGSPSAGSMNHAFGGSVQDDIRAAMEMYS